MIDRFTPNTPAPTLEANQTASFLSDLKQFLSDDLVRVERRISGSLVADASFARYAKQAGVMGGKRLRPMLTVLSFRVFGEEGTAADLEDLASIGAAVELVHAASLVHDDVLDAAETRRHRPTLHAQTGSRTAILLGDFVFTRAYDLAASCRSTFPARVIAASAASLCSGEIRQQLTSGNWEMSIAEYRQILVQKTGALCGAACRLGGWKGGASRLEQRLLKRFGILLGLAFQIYDDWLDYWGTDHVGKTLGTDLEQGKPTLPVLRYLSKSSDEDRATMLELLASDSRTRFSQVRGMLDQSDASEYTLRVAQQLSQKAVEVLEPLPNSESRQFLGAIAHFSAQRSA